MTDKSEITVCEAAQIFDGAAGDVSFEKYAHSVYVLAMHGLHYSVGSVGRAIRDMLETGVFFIDDDNVLQINEERMTEINDECH